MIVRSNSHDNNDGTDSQGQGENAAEQGERGGEVPVTRLYSAKRSKYGDTYRSISYDLLSPFQYRQSGRASVKIEI